MSELLLKRITPTAVLPAYKTEEAAGMDLCANILEPCEILPGDRKLIPTGIVIIIPMGNEGQIRPRSGLALEHGVTVLNAPGTVDSDYRGEVKVLLINHSRISYTIKPSERIAQLVIAPILRCIVKEIDDLEAHDTNRGSGGFGSTGK